MAQALLTQALSAPPVAAMRPAAKPVKAVALAKAQAPDTPAAAGPSAPAPAPEASGTASASGASELTGADISVGYADSSTPSPHFPHPWQGSPNTIVLGGGSPINAGAIKIDNPSSAPLAVQKVVVDLQRPGATPGPVFDLWSSFTIPPQGSAILTQTAPGNFDTSAYPIVGCGQTPTTADTRVPKIKITIAGATQEFLDTNHVLDTGGFDWSACRGNESFAWRRLGTTGTQRPAARLTLSPPSGSAAGSNPFTLTARFTDAGDLPLANSAVSFKILSGPNAGRTGQALTDSQGNATFSYAGGAQGTDVIVASVTNASGFEQKSNEATVAWQSASCGTAGGGSTATVTTLIYVGATSGQHSDPLTVGALLLGANGLPLAGRPLTIDIGGQANAAVTDATGVGRVTVTAGNPGALNVTVAFAGETGQSAATVSRTVTIDREDTVLRYTGKTLVGTAVPQTLTATLRDGDTLTPLAARAVKFQIGTASATANTDANGVATVQMTLPATVASGPNSLQISFAGDAFYKPATRGVPVEVYLSTSFVVWGGNTGGLKLGQRVNFWGSQWRDQVRQGNYGGNAAFKGFADPINQIQLCQVTATDRTLTPGCWESKGGNSFPPPIAVPNYIQVIVATAIDRRGPDHIGNIAASAVVKVEPGYGTSPGKEGWGTLVSVIANGTVFPAPAEVRLTQQQPAAVLPGQAIAISATVTNVSAKGATNVALSETLDGLTPPSANVTFGSLAANASATTTINATVPQIAIRGGAETSNDYIQRLMGVNGRLYTASGAASYSDADAQIYLPAEARSESVLQIPVLTVGLTGPATVAAGATVPYTVVVTNIGGGAAASGTVTVQLPNGSSQAVPMTALSAGATFTAVVSYQQPAIAPKGAGETTAAYLARLAAQDGQTLTARATASWRDANGNNYGDVQAQAFASTVRVPVLQVTAQGLPTTILPGQEATLNITVQNTGGCTATLSTVKVTNPDGTVSALPAFPLAAGQSTAVQSKWRVPLATARDDEETQAQYLARLAAMSNKNLPFTVATGWGDPAGGAYGPVDLAQSTREVVPILGLTLAGPATAQAGTSIAYQLTAANGGSAISTAGQISLTLPSGLIQTIPVPSVAVGASFTTQVSYAIPATQPAGGMGASATIVWQDGVPNPYGAIGTAASTNVTNPVVYNSVVLSPALGGPNVAGTPQALTATVKTPEGVPVANAAVVFTVTGVNSGTQTVATDAAGVARFAYTGALTGTDSIVATQTSTGGTVSVSNTVTIVWVTPVQNITTTTVHGRFFVNPDENNGTFNIAPPTAPVFSQAFPTINFYDGSPFRNNIPDVNGTVAGSIVAASGGYVAGQGTLDNFHAVFTGTFNVTSAGNAILEIYNDDAFILGIGPNANGQQPTRVSGAMEFPPSSGRTAFENFPVMGAVNRPSAGGFANTVVVNFPAAGAYPYELDYTECCPSRMILRMDVKVGAVSKPLSPTVGMTMTPDKTFVPQGGSTTLTLTARNASGAGVPNLTVRMTVSGANPREFTVTTNASGQATVPYSGTQRGYDYVQGVTTIAGMAVFSNTTEVRNGSTVNDAPATPGIFLSPEDSTVATAPVPLVSRGNLGGGPLTFHPASNPANVTVINPMVFGGSRGTVLGVFDPTTLPNGEYIVRWRGEDSKIRLRVVGENKIGRMRATVTDFTVPLSGIPITIGRTYDSLERGRIGDFGYGWDLSMGGVKLEVNTVGDVTFTVGGKRQTFFFTPRSSGFPFPYWLTPSYTAEPGTYGSLSAAGACPVLISGGGSGFVCFPETVTPYAPTSYTYTAPDGTQYKMLAGGKLESIRDLSGNTVTFGANGISSTAGNVNVPFVRDGNGRITQITDLLGNVWRYNYDASGDLVSVNLPSIATPASYQYASGHYLTRETDPRGNSAQSTFGADGKLVSVTSAVGDVTTWTYAWDATARVMTTRQTNPDGGVEISETDAVGNRIRFTDGLNRVRTYTYDSNRNMLTETDPLGKVWTNTYDARGFRTSQRNPLGQTESTVYNQYGGPTTMTDALGFVRNISYDASFRPSAITDSRGHVAQVTYDAAGNPLSLRDANGKLSSFTYDTFGRRLTQTDQLNRTRSFSYDSMGRTLTETDARGGVTRHVYDSLGRETTTTDALNGVTRMEWDNEGNKTADVDALGRRTTHTYDGENRKTLATYPDSSTMGATYDFRGNKLTESDQLGRVTKSEYDKAGQLTAVTKAFGTTVAGTVRYTYDPAGRKLTETDERGNVTTYGYDDAGRQTRMTNALGQVTQYGYDAAGQRTSMTDANGRITRYAFDARRRMTTTTFADNTTIRHTYDGMGRQLTTTDQSGRVTSKGYDDAGQLISVTDALNQITRYGYDGNSNLISQTDAAGRITGYQWDALNRRTRRTLPMGMFETVSYDAVGNSTSRVDFNGRTTTYLYDTLNRLTRKTPDASFFAAPVQYGYLANGLRASMNDVSGATTYSYDARDRLVTKTTPQGALSYGYDARGNVTSMQSSNTNGTWVNYSHDPLNRLATVVDRRLPSGTTTYSYDLVGNQGRVVYPNGVQHEYVYDTLDRLTSLPITGSGLLDRHNYTVAPTGHRLSTTRLNGRTSSYGYDATYKLVQEIISGDPAPANNGSLTYGYDPVGNRLSLASTLGAIASRTYGYDLNDRLNGDTYDANGNTLTGGGTTYLYDFEDRLIRANTVNLLYDGDGDRVRKTVGANVTSYLVDDLNPTGYSQVVDEIVNGAVQRTYSYGLQRISQNWPTPSLVSNFYVYDGHGSVRALTNATSAITDAYEYDAFGNLAASTGTTLNHNLYVGEQFDSDLGMYYFRARWYRPATGRFLNADKWEGTLDAALSHQLYLYAGSSPVHFIDPSGYGFIGQALRNAYSTLVAHRVAASISCGVGVGLGMGIALLRGIDPSSGWPGFFTYMLALGCTALAALPRLPPATPAPLPPPSPIWPPNSPIAPPWLPPGAPWPPPGPFVP